MTITHDPRHHPHRPRGSRRETPLRPIGTTDRQSEGAGRADPKELLLGDRLTLTVAEAGSLLGISRALAYELVTRGELPAIRLGRRLVVPKVAVLELLGLRPQREA